MFSEIFSRTFLIFFQTFKNCPGLPKFFTDLPKIFPWPTKSVIFLATFHKFLQFCLSNSDVSTTFGHFSPLCRCGSYTHGSQRLMLSTETIKNWGEGAKWGEKKIWGEGAFAPPCPPPLAPPLPGSVSDHFLFPADVCLASWNTNLRKLFRPIKFRAMSRKWADESCNLAPASGQCINVPLMHN